MPNEHNLKNWAKGTSGNPAGRPKGIPNRKAVARYVLNMVATPPADLLAALVAQYPNVNVPLTIELISTLRLAKKVIDEGDVAAYKALMDSAYGPAQPPIKKKPEPPTLPPSPFDKFLN